MCHAAQEIPAASGAPQSSPSTATGSSANISVYPRQQSATLRLDIGWDNNATANTNQETEKNGVKERTPGQPQKQQTSKE